MPKNIIDLSINPPKNKTELTKGNLINFFKGKGVEDKKWFAEVVRKNTTTRVNNLDKNKSEITTPDWTIIREEVAKKYFPDISSTGKRKKASNKKKPTFDDTIEEWSKL